MSAQLMVEMMTSDGLLTGHWIGGPPISQASLEDFVTAIPQGEEKDRFLRFMRKILIWDPAQRAQSAELLSDDWLMPE